MSNESRPRFINGFIRKEGSLVGSPFNRPSGTPERVETLRSAFNDPQSEGLQEARRRRSSPLAAEGVEQAVQSLPREPAVIELFKQVAGAGTLPPH